MMRKYELFRTTAPTSDKNIYIAPGKKGDSISVLICDKYFFLCLK